MEICRLLRTPTDKKPEAVWSIYKRTRQSGIPLSSAVSVFLEEKEALSKALLSCCEQAEKLLQQQVGEKRENVSRSSHLKQGRAIPQQPTGPQSVEPSARAIR